MNPVELVNNALAVLKEEGATFEENEGRTTLTVNEIPNTPWNFIKQTMETNCMLWRTFFYHYILEKLPVEELFVPTHCANCYKVVVKVNTHKELLGLETRMKFFDYPSKCGIEKRLYVKGLYGGYFYNQGLESGLERLKEIRRYYPDAILKRGCTEYEFRHGPSDQWEVLPHQLELERVVDEMVGTYVAPSEQDLNSIHQRWEEFAYKHDPTFKMELYPKCVTYEVD